MWILGLNITHDASICLLKDNEIVLHLKEERLTHIKHDTELSYSIDLIKNYTNSIDYCIYSYLNNNNLYFGPYKKILEKNKVKVKEWIDHSRYHHNLHAYCSILNSGFDDGVCLVVDSAGSDKLYGKENESIYDFNSKVDINCIYKTVVGYNNELVPENSPEYVQKEKRIGCGMAYSAIAYFMGWPHGEGKVMGMSSYGKFDHEIKPMILNKGANESLFKLSNFNHIKDVCSMFLKYPYISSFKDINENFSKLSNLSYKLQQNYENYITDLVRKSVELTNKTNVVLTGGCFLNCVANYKLLKKLPKNINIYIDPLCADDGITVGSSKYTYINQCIKNNIEPKSLNLETLYLGQPIQYNYELESNESERFIEPKEVAELISNGNIVAIYQGRSESGPRALGNRSILFDPRVENGKEIVNRVKQREWWRPFAGTVLWENCTEWFDMDRLEESPFMMYAVDVWENKRKLIPSITHVDGTCRIQTLKKKQNPNYYTLVEEFHKLTGVPILFNTSFNLAGDTIVETLDDAFNTLRNSEIEYMYLPEIKKLIYVPNEKSIC
jgi:carbamoyltransferase